MKLYVHILQAQDLPTSDSYVKLQLGKHKSKSRILRNNCNPVWNEEFVFRIHHADSDDELIISVYSYDENEVGFFNSSGDLIGRITIPVSSVSAELSQCLPPTWFSLQKPLAGKFINMDCGKILVSVSLHGKGHESSANHLIDTNLNTKNEGHKESDGLHCSRAALPMVSEGKKLMKTVASRLEKVFHKSEEPVRIDTSSESTCASSDYEDCTEEEHEHCSFEEAMEIMNSSDHVEEMPENLSGGVLLNQIYEVTPSNLNKFLFAPDSQFRKDLAELQGTTDVKEEPWTWKSGNKSSLTRKVTYVKAASTLVKAVKATEEQTYVKADGQQFAIFINVSTPDVPYGGTFNIELLYKIIPGSEVSPGEESSRLIISWAISFHHSTMMKSMIEGGARQGLKESFDQFAGLLAQNFKVLDSTDSLRKEDVLTTMKAEHKSEWKFASNYLCNFTVVSTILMVSYVVLHILLCEPSKVQGLEFNGLDLPDSFGQLISCAILVIQVERVYNMVSHFVQASLQGGSDNGMKAQGNGWILTVALIEGTNLASLGSTGLSDPYVVFTCNGKTRTSSVKLQTSNPQWNDILEFDAMEEPPSVLDVEVFDFDGPFDQATSLGHAEINFLKHTSTELADMWISLEGKLAQSSQSKLRLRIFLDNNKGVEMIKEYLTKKEKEVGKKLNLRSPHKNSTFQKLFGLPPEEFLISSFTCQLKRKMPLQGKLFLSARIVGFYANLFGHKTKFFFLWEDIEDIHVLPPSLSSVGSPTLVIVLRKGRGLDARHGAKSQDEEGRLTYYFQSFVSFNVASRTIIALWRTRTLTPEQRAEIADEHEQDQEENSPMLEDSRYVVDVEEAKLAKIYSAELPISIKSLMELFDGGKMEHKVMEKSGCLNYAITSWESVKPDVHERHLSYRFNRHVSIFGGEVSSTQQKTPIENGGWIINEVMVLHGVPFDDHFQVNMRYQIEQSGIAHGACKCDVYVGTTWLKSTKFQQRITRNITEKFTHRLKEMFELLEREVLFAVQQDRDI
ncbi:C2 calcium/lipid-binding and GRAM domain containing protein [Euphorbia peplus]|nr:C2 calcium/lipid-binding and GRAM domain containing protein [Euphorbia peplus]